MTDYISRADAIEAVAQEWLSEASAESLYVNDDDIGEYRKLAEELFEDVPSADAVSREEHERLCQECHVLSERADMYAEKYDELKIAQKWIPCDTGGMPPEGEEVLVSDGKYIWIDETVAGDATEDGYMMWWGNGSDWIDTAWMPLPEPYKGGDTE